jgi:dTDP-4-dehydrorhamnose reductase
MRVAVTGVNGLVGQRVARELRARGVDSFFFGRGAPRVEGGPYASLELTDADAVHRALRETRPDVIVNLAGLTDVDVCEEHPGAAWAANVDAVSTLARASRELGAHLVHVSTDYVFDGAAGPYDEQATPNPRGAYAMSKHAGELAVSTLLPAGQWSLARTAVVFGWPAAGRDNFGSWLVGSLSRGAPVHCFEDQWISPTYVSSCAQMLCEVAERRLSGVWHLAGAEVLDRVTFARAVCERFGFDRALVVPTRMADVKLKRPRPARAGLQVTRAQRELAAKPLSLDLALERFRAEVKGTP